MPSVTLNLGTNTGFSAGNWVQWDNRNPPDALGDISSLSADSDPRKLVRLRIFRNGNVQLQTIDVQVSTSSGFSSTEELNDTWKAYDEAITVKVSGLDDLVITGPTSCESGSTDATEAYHWINGNNTEQQTWFDLYDDDLTRPVSVVLRVTVAPTTATITTSPQSVNGGASVQLMGSATPAVGATIASLMWTGMGVFSSTTIGNPQWTAPAAGAQDQDYTLTLTATDSAGAQGVATVTITVRSSVGPPAQAVLSLLYYNSSGVPSRRSPSAIGFPDLTAADEAPSGSRGDLWVVTGEGRRADEDFYADTSSPRAIDATDTRLYVLSSSKIYVYQHDGTRQTSEEFNLHADNGNPVGIFVSGYRVYVLDGTDDKIYIYNTSGTRQTSEDFDLHADNANPYGLAGNASRMFVLDSTDSKIYVYNISGTRQESEDFDLHADNGNPTGLAATATRVYVGDRTDDLIYPYDLDGVRRYGEEVEHA